MVRPPTRGIPLLPLPNSLPVRCTEQPAESGMGFLLRSATANGLSLHQLRELAAISSPRFLWHSDARPLARVLDVPLVELEALLIDKGRYMGEAACRIRGHVFLRSDLLRLRSPQICVECVHMNGYCRAPWDCRLYTVCHLHGKPMVERCGSCGAPLRWYRPGVDVCQCGAYLRRKRTEDRDPSDLAITVAAWIAEFFEGRSLNLNRESSLPSWMTAFSLDGLCTLIRAMGSKERGDQTILVSQQAKEPIEYWQAVCARAVDRLHQLASWDDPAELAAWVWEGGLEGWALASVCQADQQVARKLIREILKAEIVAYFGSQRAVLSQMQLFEE